MPHSDVRGDVLRRTPRDRRGLMVGSIPVTNLRDRMLFRLSGANAPAPGSVVWEERNNRVIVHVEKLQVQVMEGWVICTLELEADDTGSHPIDVVFYLGSKGEGDGLNAAVTLNLIPEAVQLGE